MKRFYILIASYCYFIATIAQNTELAFGQNWANQLTGTIGGFSTKMTLTQDVKLKENFSNELFPTTKRNCSKELAVSPYREYYEGFYFYEKDFEPMRFYGYRDDKGRVILEVMPEHELGEAIERFVGRFDGHTFSGEWRQLKTNKSLTFRFETFSPPTTFDYFSASDSTLIKLDKKSIKGRFSTGSLFPKSGFSDKTKDSLIVKFASHFMPDTTYELYQKWRFYTHYQEEKNDWFNWLKNERFYNAEYQYRRKTTTLVWCDKSYLTICVTRAYYTGYFARALTFYETFDLKNNKILLFEDVFNKDALQDIKDICKKKAKTILGNELFEETFSDDCSDFYFDENSFVITPKGVFFNPHNKNSPDETDADVKMFIPFDEISKYMHFEYGQ